MASVFKRKGDRRWRIAWYTHEGRRRERSSHTTDYRMAERLAAELEAREMARREGLIDPRDERLAAERKRPIEEHVADYAAHLEGLGRSDRHVRSIVGYLRGVAAALEWRTLADVDGHTLAAHLADLARARGTGARTFNANAGAWRAFANWCIRTGRLASNPLATVGTRNVESDRRRVRRDLTDEELRRIVEHGGGHWRGMAYRVAAATGLRAGELASLTPESFDLDAEPPLVHVEAAYSKHRRRDAQPLPHELAADLRAWLAGRPRGKGVFPIPQGRGGAMLQADMLAARARWIEEAPTAQERARREESDFLRPVDSAGRVADFHSLRVTFVSRVIQAGANPKQAMDLARHSDPRLTFRTYARVGLLDLSAVVDRLTPQSPAHEHEAEALRATGTEGQTPSAHPTQIHTRATRETALRGATRRNEDCETPMMSAVRNSRKDAHLRNEARGGAARGTNAGEGTRTPNLLIRSQMLYPIELRPRRGTTISGERAWDKGKG
jgi:integrase/recombinase XerC